MAVSNSKSKSKDRSRSELKPPFENGCMPRSSPREHPQVSLYLASQNREFALRMRNLLR